MKVIKLNTYFEYYVKVIVGFNVVQADNTWKNVQFKHYIVMTLTKHYFILSRNNPC